MPVNIQTAIMRTHDIPLHFYRYLYWRVGKRWHWQKRMRMSDAELTAVLRDPKNCVTVLYLNGSPAGFFEFNRGNDDVTELSYFGLMKRRLALVSGNGSCFRRFTRSGRITPRRSPSPPIRWTTRAPCSSTR